MTPPPHAIGALPDNPTTDGVKILNEDNDGCKLTEESETKEGAGGRGKSAPEVECNCA
jgi:hypothetical protein